MTKEEVNGDLEQVFVHYLRENKCPHENYNGIYIYCFAEFMRIAGIIETLHHDLIEDTDLGENEHWYDDFRDDIVEIFIAHVKDYQTLQKLENEEG